MHEWLKNSSNENRNESIIRSNFRRDRCNLSNKEKDSIFMKIGIKNIIRSNFRIYKCNLSNKEISLHLHVEEL